MSEVYLPPLIHNTQVMLGWSEKWHQFYIEIEYYAKEPKARTLINTAYIRHDRLTPLLILAHQYSTMPNKVYEHLSNATRQRGNNGGFAR